MLCVYCLILKDNVKLKYVHFIYCDSFTNIVHLNQNIGITYGIGATEAITADTAQYIDLIIATKQ